MSFGAFGSTGQQQQQTSTPFGGFGSSSFSFPSSTASTFSAPQPSTSTFGQGGLFGSTPSSSSTSGFGGGGFSFGSTTSFGSGSVGSLGSWAPGTGGGFSFGAFGSSQPSQSTFSFGSSAFPSTSTTTQQPGAFGTGGLSAFNPQGSSGSFGLFGSQPLQPQQQTAQASAPPQADQSASSPLVKQLMDLKAAYDPTSPLCRFQSIFYNRVADPSKLRSFIPPPHANPALYQRAVRSNPDPTSLTPSLAVGFEDLKRRLEAQREARAVHEAAVKGIRESVEEMRSVHWAYTVPVLKGLRETAEEQGLRVLRIVNRLVEVEARGVALTEEERDYRAKMERVAVEVQREGWMEKAREMQRRVRMGGLGTAGDGAVDGGEVQLSAEDREKLRAVIDTQTRALEFLIDTVKEDLQLLQTLQTAQAAVDGAHRSRKQAESYADS